MEQSRRRRDRVFRPTERGPSSPDRPLAQSPFRLLARHLSKAVITIMTTSARMKLRSSHQGRSGPDKATQATIARIRQINDQESIVRGRCLYWEG